MDNFVKLTIALVFDARGATSIADLAARATEHQEVQYVSGRESIPHCTLVQAKFELEPLDNAPGGEVRDTSDPRVQKIIMSISELLGNADLAKLVSDVGVHTSKVSVDENEKRVYVGIDLMRTTQLQQAHNLCVDVMQKAGGSVTSQCGTQYFPHVTLSYLEPGSTPNDIAEELRSFKYNVLSVTPIIGLNGDGGRLLEIISKAPTKSDLQASATKRRSFLR